MESQGGTILMHGDTHQYGNLRNCYDGVSADDFEFYASHVDPNTNGVVYDGPTPADSNAWADARIGDGLAEFQRTGITAPTIFEFPHYAGTKDDYEAARGRFDTRYERSLYFTGMLSGGAPRYDVLLGQFFPYPVNDVHGSRVLPENLGNYEPVAFNNHPPRLPADLVAAARANLVVRDGFASFFYHPYYALEPLRDIVTGIQALGYTFVSPTSL
jgi:uncharacterized protein YdaL